MCYRQICIVVLWFYFVILCTSCALWRWRVCFYIICCKLVVCGGLNAFDFCGDPRLVETCRGEFAGYVFL